MMSLKNALIGLLLVLALACLYLPTAGAQSPAAQGKKIFDSKCYLCHGLNGKGDGPTAAAYSPPPANFTIAPFWNKGTAQIIAKTVKNGKGAMPSFELSQGEVKALIAYMTKAFKPH